MKLSLADVRQVFRLLGDCRDLGHDCSAWVARAVSGLRGLFDAIVVIGTFHEALSKTPAPSEPLIWDVGWPTARDRDAWMGLVRNGDVFAYPTATRINRDLGRLRVRSREQLVPDREGRLCREFDEDRKPLGQDDTLIGIQRPAVNPAIHQLFSINRAVGDGRFDGRQRRLLRLFVQEVNALSGTALAVDRVGPFASIGPRVRQVLDALVEGESEKMIAARLGLSRHTVHDHVKALYRRAGVSSRGELLAFYHRFHRG